MSPPFLVHDSCRRPRLHSRSHPFWVQDNCSREGVGLDLGLYDGVTSAPAIHSFIALPAAAIASPNLMPPDIAAAATD
jgi:hypothetical protein